MAAKETKAAKLIRLFGGVTKVARAIDRDKAIPSRWDSRGPKGYNGRVPPHHNAALLAAAKTAEPPAGMNRKTFVEEIRSCLDEHVCPTCHQQLPAGVAVDKRLA